MQFAGQRTDMELNPIGEPYNILVKLSDDTLPSPDAIMVTKISPQQTVADGITEAEFAKLLADEIFSEDTVTVGFNNIRFDDEFIRHLFWRNFRDPYEWSWRDGRSRWDLLDVVRMTRALRPDGIIWPVDAEGNPTNRLELLTKENGIAHENAHDALADVWALIEVTKLIKTAQPQLYGFLFTMRDKNAVKKLVNLDDKQPFVYTSGRYEQEYQKTTVAFPLTSGKNGNVVVYDLRYDPTPFVELSSDELAKKIFATYQERKEADFVPLPVKELQYNRAPAVAPLGVLEKDDGWTRTHLTSELIEQHRKVLLTAPHFAENVRSLYEKTREYPRSEDPEAQLYDSFVPDVDRMRIEVVRNADERTLADFHPEFNDERLAPLLLHYKARNFPRTLSEDETLAWESWRSQHIKAQLPGFLAALRRIAATADDAQQFLLQELQLWAESIIPVDED
jgi:exodeoxyribonuclease-1